MSVHSFKLSLLAVAMTAALAACGGGGDDTPVTPAAPAAPAAPTPTTPATPTTPTAPTAPVVGTSSGTASDTAPTINIGLPPAPTVPVANRVANTATPGTAAAGTQAANAWAAIQDWRSKMRTEEEGSFGVGLLTQTATLDTLAAQLMTSLPNLTSTNATDRAVALASAAQQMTNAGFPISVVHASSSTNTAGIEPGAFCPKSLFSALPGVEFATSGMRSAGVSIPETTGTCVFVAGLASAGEWQLPPTGSSSVYPFPGKVLTLPRYFGDWASLGFSSQPGHAVFVSVASVDALPFAVPGAGSGAAIAASAITLQTFTVTAVATGVAAPARILVPTGMVRASTVTAEESTALRFPTSIALIPTAPLTSNALYRASFTATVNGRPVQRTWEFTTAD